MSFSMKNLTLLLTAMYLNSAYSSNNIQCNSIQYNNYSNIGTVYNNCTINNNVQNLNNNSNNIMQINNIQSNTYSNINRVYDNCTISNNVINNNVQINPFFYPFYYFYPINCFLNTNDNNTFQDNTNYQKSSNITQYDINTSNFYPKNYWLKQALPLIEKNKHEAHECLEKFIKIISNGNKIDIPNKTLLNWLESASESISYNANKSLKKQKSSIITKIVTTCNMDSKEVLAKVVKLVALNDGNKISDEVKKEFNAVQEKFNKNELEKDILELRKKTKEYYEPVENLKQLLINALKDKSFSVEYNFPNDNNTIQKIITHLIYSGHIIDSKDIGREKHALEETLIHGIEDMKYYEDIKNLIKQTYNDEYKEISLYYRNSVYNIIQYCLINPLIEKFVSNNNQYISDFVINKFVNNKYDNSTAVLCVIDKNNHNKLVLNLNIKKNRYKRKNVNIEVTNTIKSFYGISDEEYQKFEQKNNNYKNTYVNGIKQNDKTRKKQYEEFKGNNNKK